MTVFRRLFLGTMALAVTASAQSVGIRAATMLDGKGGIQKNGRVPMEGSEIARVEAGGKGPVDLDLGSATLMPGWIDTHVHADGHFNKQGRADTKGEPPAEFILRAQGNAVATLQAGFTTVQSIGA